MSLENEDQKPPYEASETIPEVEKKLKVSYTREFLLSLCNLDICKKLPSGFDESWPSEFEDGLQSIHDRPRMSGNLSSQGVRRNEYGSSSITRGDSDSYPRGISGRRGSQFSGQSDQDSDSKSSRDSDSGRHFGHQSRRTWQTPKHDGLLGSGSFPRPSGYAAGISSSKAQGNEHYQLKKSNEPYQPPRPYKAVPYSRRDTDSYNDETFGSTESTSEDRAEEERRRRASFDLMRKEQQKAFQEKQKLNMEKHKADGVSDLGELSEDSREKQRVLGRNNELDSSSAAPVLNDSEKSSFASHSPLSRPLVPPGFTNNILDKSVGLKSSIRPPLSEVEKPITGERLFHDGAKSIQNGTHDSLERKLSLEKCLYDGQPEDETKDALVLNNVEDINSHSTSNSSSYKVGMENQLHQNSRHLDAHETLGGPEIFELDAKVLEDKIVGESSRICSTPNSEKNFSNSLSVNGSRSDTAERHHDGKLDVKWSSVESSKFTQRFSEEDAKPTDDIRFGRPNDLLSLIVSGDKGRYQVSDLETEDKLSHDFSYKSSQYSNKLRYEVPSAANGISEQLGISNKKEIFPAIITCEDLEQSILSDYSEKTSNVQPWIQGWGTTSVNTERPRGHVDDYASGHLLSLLLKGTDPSNSTPNSSMDLSFAGKLLVSEEHDKGNAVNEPKGEVGTENIDNLGKTLTMEALFGSAFMKELQSVDAPVSVHRGGPVESTRTDAPEAHGLSFPNMDNDIFSLEVDQTRLERTKHDSSTLFSNQRKQTKPGKGENWQGYDDSQIDSNRHPEAASKHGGFDGVVEFQLPEEESLISLDNQNHPISTFIPSGNSGKNDFFFSNAPQKLAATNAINKDKHIMLGSESLPFTHGPHEQMEQNIPYHNFTTQQSLSQFQPPQMTHARPSFHPMDSHRAHTTSQMKFTDPELILNQESQANQHFLGNMIRPPFHHSSAGVAGFEVPAHHPSMLHQMQMSGNNPPHLLLDFTRGSPMSHPGNQPTGIQEMNPIRGFPLGPGQPNIGTLGMPIPPPGINGNPESFQRLIEIELKARSKQIHPLAAGRNEGIHHRELDMDFRQR